MGDAEVEVKKWGNSLAVIVPADLAREEGLQPNDRAIIRITKVRYPDPSSFGSLKDWKVDPQKVKDRLRREDHD